MYKYISFFTSLFFPAALFAGEPTDMALGFQPAASPVAEQLHQFNNFLLVIIIAIALFVLILLAYTTFRFRASRNKTPSKTSHNTLIEVIWTAVPVIILVFIIVPSIKIQYFMDKVTDPELTIKVTGYQWYWGYEYPQHDISFESYMIPDNEITTDQRRLLSTDKKIVLPIDTKIQILITGADVIHSWAVPAFGIKTDAVPGRTNETWVSITKEGTYYGQCSEICGTGHAFMPIEIQAVSKEKFEEWLNSQKSAQNIEQDSNLIQVSQK